MSEPKPQPIEDVVVRVVPETIDREGPGYRVYPDPLQLKPGQKVVFHYDGTEGATLFVPIPGVFPQQQYEFVEAEEGMVLEATVTEKPPKFPREFPYCIYCRDLNFIAAGRHSPPRMIIDPPAI